jgi:hypothetical protein
MNAMNVWKRVFYIVLLVSLLTSGCSAGTAVLSAAATVTPGPTATTAPTHTPAPTNTFTPTATATHTPTPKPTATATPNTIATIHAAETEVVDTVLKIIEPDLQAYGYTLADGHLVWASGEEMEITVEEYGMSRFVNLDAPSASNFIIQTNIKWNTTGGLAGCGLFFRMEDGTSEGKSNQFMMYRLQNAPAWDIAFYEKSLWQRSLTNWVYANVIEDTNDSTNVVALVVNGRNIYPYINGKKQRLVEDITLKEGTFAISATQDSGLSTCIFTDTWIWAIDKQ